MLKAIENILIRDLFKTRDVQALPGSFFQRLSVSRSLDFCYEAVLKSRFFDKAVSESRF